MFVVGWQQAHQRMKRGLLFRSGLLPSYFQRIVFASSQLEVSVMIFCRKSNGS